jgi:hypothetical protein
MPTPTTAFADAAAKYGNVDPDDVAAVQQWFMEALPKLPPDTIEQIFRELLAEDGAPASRLLSPSYPARASLPSLSASPSVRGPNVTERWAHVLGRVIRQLTRR